MPCIDYNPVINTRNTLLPTVPGTVYVVASDYGYGDEPSLTVYRTVEEVQRALRNDHYTHVISRFTVDSVGTIESVPVYVPHVPDTHDDDDRFDPLDDEDF